MIRTVVLRVKHNRSRLIRVGVVGATLCLLPGVGFLVTEVPPAFVLVALLVPFGVLAVVKRLELGLAAMLLAAVFVGFRIPTGTASEIVISLVICLGCIALWIIHMLVIDKRISLTPGAVNLPLLAFMVTVPVSWAWSRAFRDVLVREAGHPLVSVVAGLVMVLLPGCLLLVANNVRSVNWLRVMVCVLLGEGVVILVLDAGPAAALQYLLYSTGVIGVNSHGLISMWCLAFAFSLALFDRRLHWLVRCFLLLYVAGFVHWGFMKRVTWLSGWVPTFVAAGVIGFLRSKKLFVILLLVIVVGAGTYYLQTSFEAETEESGFTRLAAYQVNWRVTGKHLLFGTGPAGYASYYMSYFPTEAMASHSNYIDLLAQTGIVGSVFYMWFFGAQAWGSYKLWRELRGRGDFAESLAAAVLGGTAGCVIAMALGDWLLPFAYTQGIVGFDLAMFNWFFMGSVWALRNNLSDGESTTSSLQSARGAIS
jgi:O-antigen ligase